MKTLNLGLVISLFQGLEKGKAPGMIPGGREPWDSPISWLADGDVWQNTVLGIGQIQIISAKVSPVTRFSLATVKFGAISHVLLFEIFIYNRIVTD